MQYWRANGWDGANKKRAAQTGSREEHQIALVMLDCGHPEIVVVHPGKSLRGSVAEEEWECPETGTVVKASSIVAVFSGTEWEELSAARIDELLGAAEKTRRS